MKFKVASILVTAVALVSCSVTRQIPAEYPVLGEEYRGYEGTLQSVIYPTSIPGPAQRRMYVYLPQDYEETEKEHPVLYMLHGARGDEASWITQGSILQVIDSLRREGVMEDMLVVFPNMNSYDSEEDFGKSRLKSGVESFFEVDGAVETSFVEDVVRAVDRLYRTVPSKEGRAIAGLSLGGMQALYISADAPSVFGYVGVLSAPLHSFVKKGPYKVFYDNIDSKIDTQFAEPPQVYNVYVGKKDVYRKTMDKFCKDLTARGYSCKFVIEPGGHQWPLWQSFATSFIYDLGKVFTTSFE